MRLTIAVIIFMTLWLPLFVYSQYKWQRKNYLYTKTFSSILFMTIGILGHFAKAAPTDYSLLIISALVLGLIGDVLLVFSDKDKYFKLGLLSFLMGQLVYGILFLKYGGFSYYDILIYAVIVSASLLVYTKSKLEFKNMKFHALVYMLAISFMLTMALSTLYKNAFPPITTAFIVAGSCLFAASDMVLAFNMFKPNSKPMLKRLNLVLYYYGQLILAVSIISFAI